MSSFQKRLIRFWSELRRRKTIRTAIAYLIIIAAVVGPASDILDGLGAPEWILQTIIIGLFLGFPIVLVLSWLFDFTLHGIERTADLEEDKISEEKAIHKSALESPDVIDDADKPSVDIESGTAHRYQVTLLRTTVLLTENGSVVNDPEELIGILPQLENLIGAAATKYSALEVNREGATFVFVFGYPSTYEDDAIRAAAMALYIQEDLTKFTKTEYTNANRRLIATSGVHSDLVVIDSDDSKDSGINIVGTATQETAWIQSLIEPGNVAMDELTHQLLRNRLSCESIGEFNNVQAGAVTSVFKAVSLIEAKLDPSIYDDFKEQFLGRASEISLIMNHWERALEGEDQFLVLRGEPGIGKSTITREVVSQVNKTDRVFIIPLYCSPIERNTAFQPIIEFMMGPGFGLRDEQIPEKQQEKIHSVLKRLDLDAEHIAPLLSNLLAIDSSMTAPFSESARKELITYLLEMLRITAANYNLLLIVEDLHWADASTMEVFSMLVNEGTDAGMLCLFTTRPHLKPSWESRSTVTTLDLQKLSKKSTSQLVDNILKDLQLPENFTSKLVEEAGGNPLFAEELAKAIFETAQANPDSDVNDLVLPASLQRSLASRVDNLGKAKPLLQLCSLLGREFDYKLLKTVSEAQNEAVLQAELELLVNAEFLYQSGAVPESKYSFKHILIQETAYQSMLKSTRKNLHERVATVLENEEGYKEHQPEVLAYHYEGSLQLDKAIACWTQAGQKSMAAFAMAEAAELANNGLSVLRKLPASPEIIMAEMGLQGIKGRALLTANGYAEPEVEESFNRALELCDIAGDVPQLFSFLAGLWSYFQIGGTVENAAHVAERLARLAENDESPAKKVQAHYCNGYTAYRAGKFDDARRLLTEAHKITEEYEADYTEFTPARDDGRIHNRTIRAHIHWQLGNLQEALELNSEAIKLAEELKNPIGIIFSYFLSTWLMHLNRDYDQAIHWGEKTVTLAKEKHLKFWIGNSEFIMAFARFQKERERFESGPEHELEIMLKLAAASKRVGARFGTIELLLDTAEALAWNKRIREASELLLESKELLAQSGEAYLLSEQYRIEAIIEQQGGNIDLAIQLFKQAIDVAEGLRAHSYRKRTAKNLSELYDSLNDSENSEAVLATANKPITTTANSDQTNV